MELYSPRTLAPSGHFSEMMAKKTGPFGPVLFIGEITSHRIDMPDMISVLFDSTVRREVAHIGNVQHRFCGPLFLKLVKFVNFILTIDIAAIIRQYLVVIAEVDQRINQIAIAPGSSGLNTPLRFASAPDAAPHLSHSIHAVCSPDDAVLPLLPLCYQK